MVAVRVSEYLSPRKRDDEEVAQQRRRGRHACQVAVDTIAYGQNIPFRLLMVDKLQNLPGEIGKLVKSEEGKLLLADENLNQPIGISPGDLAKLYDPGIVKLGADWVLSLATNEPKVRPLELPARWESAILRILPHLERAVWLTELGNALPAHALARMLDHWALYVLFWCYVNRTKFDPDTQDKTGSDASIDNVLGIDHYCVRVGSSFEIAGPTRPDDASFRMYRCVPVVGPFWQSCASQTCQVVDHEKFIGTFNLFVDQVAKLPGWDEAREIKPSDTELRDALQSRVDLTCDEATLRASSCQRALVDYFLNAEVSQELVDGKCLTRTDWETAAGYCCWLARWDQLLTAFEKRRSTTTTACPGYLMTLCGHEIALELRHGDAQANGVRQWSLTLLRTTELTHDENLCGVEKLKELILEVMPGVHIDSPEMFFNRTRERQNAAWAAQIIAVNNLINSHGDIQQIGKDDVLGALNEPQGCRVEEASHLLRGYGGRVCHYLLSMARADVADVYWLDYAQVPPRLVHVGGYARMLAHRVRRQEIHRQFDEKCWKDESKGSQGASEASLGVKSRSQAYRVTATLGEDPPAEQQVQGWGDQAQSDASELESQPAYAYFDSYAFPKPIDAMALPLLVNGRVVGALTLAGINTGQFDRRLFVPLRRVANLLAQTIYQASQLWQMRQLNWLVTHVRFETWRQHDEDNQFNPLKKISACLCNVFLCRAVHIWLKREDDDSVYELHGYNKEDIFRPNGNALKDPPLFEYEPCRDASKSQSLSRAFVTFALDAAQYESEAKGRYVQARYSGGTPNTANYKTASALNGMMLGADYLHSYDTRHGCFRSEIFATHGMNDMMAFALLRTSTDNPQHVELLGGVTLHDSYSQPAEGAESTGSRPWPTAWAPVVAHVQTYLPYLLSQVELLHNPMEHVRRFLLHAGRSELLAVRDNIVQLRHHARDSLKPDGIVRQRVRQLQAKLEATNISAGEAFAIEQHLDAAWAASTRLISDSFINNLAFMVKAIERHRDVADLNVFIEAGPQWIDLKESLQGLLTGQQTMRQGLNPTLEGFSAKTEVFLPQIWWEQIAKNLIENAGKYARDMYNVAWSASENRLRFENHARFDSILDTPDKLLRYGVRGSAARAYIGKIGERTGPSQPAQHGFGIGLWGVQLLCELCSITFTMQIKPLEKTITKYADGSLHGLAAYQFDLVFDRTVMRRPVGGAACPQ